MRLTLNNLSHTYTGDIMMLLVGPQGQKFVPMGNAGSNTQSNNITLKLWDGAADPLPTAPLATGEYKPASYFDSGDYTSPAPVLLIPSPRRSERIRSLALLGEPTRTEYGAFMWLTCPIPIWVRSPADGTSKSLDRHRRPEL